MNRFELLAKYYDFLVFNTKPGTRQWFIIVAEDDDLYRFTGHPVCWPVTRTVSPAKMIKDHIAKGLTQDKAEREAMLDLWHLGRTKISCAPALMWVVRRDDPEVFQAVKDQVAEWYSSYDEPVILRHSDILYLIDRRLLAAVGIELDASYTPSDEIKSLKSKRGYRRGCTTVAMERAMRTAIREENRNLGLDREAVQDAYESIVGTGKLVIDLEAAARRAAAKGLATAEQRARMQSIKEEMYALREVDRYANKLGISREEYFEIYGELAKLLDRGFGARRVHNIAAKALALNMSPIEYIHAVMRKEILDPNVWALKAQKLYPLS